MHIHGDYETRSVVDIRKAGADVYAEHWSTDVLCFHYAFDNGPVRRWRPGLPNPQELFDRLAGGAKLVAHNAYFELVIWNKVCVPRYGWPRLRPDQVVDTMAICYAHSLPGSLDGAARAIGLTVRKDETGRRIMLKLCRPRGLDDAGLPLWYEPEDAPADFDALYRYCDNDVVVERELEKKLPALKPSEQRLWELDFIINQRGIPIDLATVRTAIRCIEQEATELNAELRRITNGAVPAATNPGKLVTWLREVRGLDVHSMTKADLRELLARKDLEPDVRRALVIRAAVGKTSTKKLQAMLDCTSDDGRARGLHQFHAASTGRWGGRRIQTQNMPRPEKGIDIEWCIDMLQRPWRDAYDAIRLVYGDVTAAISSCLRGMIGTRPGRRLVVMDFSNIEGRVLPWLAGEQWKLDLFDEIDHGHGKDVYLVAASGIYNENIDDKEDPRRQVGKVSELALGFQGGAGAFANMAAVYGLDVAGILPSVWPKASMERKKDALRSWLSRGRASEMTREAWVAAELVKLPWRDVHPKTVQFWRDIEDAAIAAVADPGLVTYAGEKIRFKCSGSFLLMQLPSGRCLTYPFPKLVERPMPWKGKDGKPARKRVLTYFSRIDESKKAKIVQDPHNESKWARVATYGGELTENAVQAAARDCLAYSQLRCEAAGYPLVMHVHDENGAELPDGVGSTEEMSRIMCEIEPWMAGLPIHAAGWEGVRYRK